MQMAGKWGLRCEGCYARVTECLKIIMSTELMVLQRVVSSISIFSC